MIPIPKWFLNTDEGTWQGHLIVALVLFWPGYWLGVLVASGLGLEGLAAASVSGTMGTLTGFWGIISIFGYREADNMWGAVKKFGARLAFRRKGLDGIGDFTFPVLGVFACINLTRDGLGGGFGGFLVSIVAAEIAWLMIVAKKRNGDVLSVFKRGQ